MNIRDGLKKIGTVFLSGSEAGSQEGVYKCMPELCLKKVFPRTVCVFTDFPEKRVRVAKSKPELDELHDDSADIHISNMIERYVIQPNTIPAVDNMCLVEFAAYYFQKYKTDCINDAQPGILTEDATELHVQLSVKHKF